MGNESAEFVKEGIKAYNDKKYVEAAQLYAKAATAGNRDGMYLYGKSLTEGNGCPKNIEEGMKWLQKAEDMGHSLAMRDLGELLYTDSPELSPKFVEALTHFQKSAEAGDEFAMVRLGEIYNKLSMKWMQQAAKNGNQVAKDFIGRYYQADVFLKSILSATPHST